MVSADQVTDTTTKRKLLGADVSASDPAQDCLSLDCVLLTEQQPSLSSAYKASLLIPAETDGVSDGFANNAARRLLGVGVSAHNTAIGTHSASGNLSTAASYRAGPTAAGVGVALVDGDAAVDQGTADVDAAGKTTSKVGLDWS